MKLVRGGHLSYWQRLTLRVRPRTLTAVGAATSFFVWYHYKRYQWIVSECGGLFSPDTTLSERPVELAARKYMKSLGEEPGIVISISGTRRAKDIINESLTERLVMYFLHGSGRSFEGVQLPLDAVLKEGWVVVNKVDGTQIGHTARETRIFMTNPQAPYRRIVSTLPVPTHPGLICRVTDIYPSTYTPSQSEYMMHYIANHRAFNETIHMQVDNVRPSSFVMRLASVIRANLLFKEDHKIAGNAARHEGIFAVFKK